MTPGITCQDITEQVTLHMEGEQSWGGWLKFRMHVLMCRDCMAYLRQMEMTVSTLARMPGEPLPVEVEDELLKRFRDWHANS